MHLYVPQSWFALIGRMDLLSTLLMLLPSESAKSDFCIMTQGYHVM